MSESFVYLNGSLHAEGVDLATLAGAVGTPFYCYSTATIEIGRASCRERV